MKLLCYKNLHGNFGDDLNAWLWPRLVPGLLDNDSSELFLGIGTLLTSGARIPADPVKVVFGSGSNNSDFVPSGTWKFYSVRGPLTAKKLGLQNSFSITDPAILVARAFQNQSIKKTGNLLFMPHRTSTVRAKIQGVNMRAVCKDLNISYIDPGDGVETVLHAIADASCVIAEAMHGAIVADAFRIPWIPIQVSIKHDSFKWNDWCQSLNLNYLPYVGDPFDVATNLGFARVLTVARKVKPILSNDRIFESALERLEKVLLQISDNYLFCKNVGEEIAAESISDNQANRNWFNELSVSLEEIESVIPANKSMILVDQDEWMTFGQLRHRPTFPFLEKDRYYGGPPAEDKVAIQELERLRDRGADFIVFASHTFWWLDHYQGWNKYLRNNYVAVLENDRVKIFNLRGKNENGSI